MVPAPAPAYAPAPAVAASAPRPREFGLDWLRVIAFAILIAYHTGMYFVPWPWLVKNGELSAGLAGVMVFFNLWRLPLLFFVSGAGTWFNLERRGPGGFAVERLQRLGIPLLFGTFVVCPPQTYVARLVQGVRYPSYLAFWKTTLNLVPYPRGNMDWIHLWFVGYLLAFSLAGLPVLALLRGRTGRALVERLARACERPGVIYLLAVPGIAAAVLLGPRWPRSYDLVNDLAYDAVAFVAFLLGFVVCGSARFLDEVERRRHAHLAVAAVLTVLVYAQRIAGRVPGVPDALQLVAWTAVDHLFSLAMILAMVGWSRARLNRDGPALRYANAAVYPFYIVHQTVTVLLGWAWLGWSAPIPVKFLALAAGTFLGSWAVFELVRRTAVTRVLFGMKR